MPPTLQTRPGKLDWRAYPGQSRTIRLSGWPDGYIDDRSYELRIRGLDAVVGLVDDSANTVTFTVDLDLPGGNRKLTVVDTSTDPEDVIIRGELYLADSSSGGAESDTEVTVVTDDDIEVALEVTVLSGIGGGGDMTAAEILALLLTVDGSGSGLDADLLDGQTGSHYLDRANHTGSQAISTVTGLQAALDGKQPLDSDLTTLAGAGNSAVLAATTASFLLADESKLDGIEAGAEVNNISDANVTDLTDAGDTSLHFHSADRNRANHTGTQTASTISDFESTVKGYFDSDLATLSLPASTTITTHGAALVGGANAAATLSTLGLDADLATFAVPASTTISSFAAGYLDETTIAATLTAMGLDADLATLSLPASTTISSFIAGLLNDADAATARTTLEIPTLVDGNRVDTSLGSGNLTFNVDLTEGVSGGDTLVGGTGALEDLEFQSTSHATRGDIRFRDFVVLITEDKNSTAGTPMLLVDVSSARTFSFDEAALNAGNSVTGVAFRPSLVYSALTLNAGNLFDVAAVVKNNNGAAQTIGGFVGLHFRPTLQGDGATATIISSSVADAPTVNRINSGGTAVTHTTIAATMAVDTGATVTTRTGLSFADATGAGTVTTQIGVDVPALAKATTNIGIRNAATRVATPSVATLTAAGNSIAANAEVKRLDNTSGGSLTLTSAPTIADGQDGQILVLFNSSANNVVLQDQGTLASSNLRLAGAANLTLGQRDSVTLMFSSTLGDWIQIGASNN